MAADLTRRTLGEEYMDRPDVSGPDLNSALGDLEFINRRLGGHRASIAALDELTADIPTGGGIHLLDVGSGGCDLAAALGPWARRRRLRLNIVAVDFNRRGCALAARRTAALQGIEIVAADAFALPFEAASFDYAHCSLFLHHFANDKAVELLRILYEVSRRGVVVNDLHRHRLSYAAVDVGTRLLARGNMVRHDGPLSVLRGFRRGELEELANRAGFSWSSVRRRWAFRYVATLRK